MTIQTDDDFLNSAPPAVDPEADRAAAEAAQAASSQQSEAEAAAEAAQAAAQQSAQEQADAAAEAQKQAAAQKENVEQSQQVDNNAAEQVDDEATLAAAKAALATQEQAAQKSNEQQGTKEQTEADKAKAASAGSEQAQVAVNYEESYKKIMAPFKANGKEITLKDPEEAVRLMQMGANFTRKMQELAPQRKLLLMLQNNDLADEAKLSFAIDLMRKDPAAIQKLIKDSGIDPLGIDPAAEPTYTPGNHVVSDKTAHLQTILHDLQSSEAGQKTVQLLHSTWDDASKQELGNDPEILNDLHQQRESGVYDRISSEVDRQRMLGNISPSVPFIKAYKQVGDAMVAAQQAEQARVKAAAAQAAQPIAQTTTPAKQLSNADKASAASSTTAAPKKAQAPVNWLAMSDEEFAKASATINR